MICLKKFWPHIAKGGAILIDDYYTFAGCSRAVHDFLSEIKATENIRGAAGQACRYTQDINVEIKY
jgi:O-methyltransferase